jgi:CheY-specific phosphatase CheX
VTTEVELSGPAMVKGRELRSATTDAPIVVEMKVAAMP